MDDVPALDTFYSSSDALDVVDSLSGCGVHGDGTVLDELDGIEGCKESCVCEHNFADTREKMGVLEGVFLKGSQDVVKCAEGILKKC